MFSLGYYFSGLDLNFGGLVCVFGLWFLLLIFWVFGICWCLRYVGFKFVLVWLTLRGGVISCNFGLLLGLLFVWFIWVCCLQCLLWVCFVWGFAWNTFCWVGCYFGVLATRICGFINLIFGSGFGCWFRDLWLFVFG